MVCLVGLSTHILVAKSSAKVNNYLTLHKEFNIIYTIIIVLKPYLTADC